MCCKKTKYFWTIALSFAFLTSCVDFKEQTMTYRYYPKKDELRIFQVYEAIHATGQNGKITDDEKKELGDVIMGQHTFFFANWAIEYDRKVIQEQITQLQNKDSKDEAEKALLEVMKQVVDSVKVTNGQFYLNGDRELCAYQEVTVSNVSKLIAKINQLGVLALKSKKMNENGKQEFVCGICKNLRLDGNQLMSSGTQPKKDYDAMREMWAKNKRLYPLFLKKDFQLDRKNSTTTFTLGNKEASRVQVEMGNISGDKEYNSIVHEYLRGSVAIQENLDIDKIRDKFLGD